MIGAGLLEVVRRQLATAKRTEAEDQAKQITQNAQREAETLIKEAKLEAKDLIFQAKTDLEKEQKVKLAELAVTEKRLIQREENLDRKLGAIEKREADAQKRDQEFVRREEGLAKKEAACAKVEREHREALERVAGMTGDEAKKQLMVEMESQARLDAAGIVLVEVDADARTLRRAPFEHRLSVPGDVFVPECGWRIFAQIRTSRDQMVSGGVESREALEIAVPAAQMAAPVTVRNRRPGDRIKPLGAPGRKKVQDLLVDRKVPRHERDRVPVVVDGHGRLVWVVGVAMADEFRVTAPEVEVVVFTAERQ